MVFNHWAKGSVCLLYQLLGHQPTRKNDALIHTKCDGLPTKRPWHAWHCIVPLYFFENRSEPVRHYHLWPFFCFGCYRVNANLDSIFASVTSFQFHVEYWILNKLVQPNPTWNKKPVVCLEKCWVISHLHMTPRAKLGAKAAAAASHKDTVKTARFKRR